MGKKQYSIKYDAATITEENKVDKHIDMLINS